MDKIRYPLRVITVLGVAMVVCVLLTGSGTAAQGEPKSKGKGKGKGSEVIQLDLNQLPPSLARELRQLLQTQSTPEPKKDKKDKKDKKSKARTINLTEAIRIAEGSSNGEAVKAERKTKDGLTQFKVEVLSSSGEKSKITLDERGKRLEPDPKDDKKGKGKKKKD